MSKYTTEVRYICETLTGQTESFGADHTEQIIKASAPLIFDFNFPLFDETYRQTLIEKIVRHFYLYEIGMETVGLWKHYLRMRMNEIMPRYNKLYYSETLEFNPLYDVDYTKTYTKESTGTNSSSGKSESNDTSYSHDTGETTNNTTVTDDTTDRFSDTPQGSLSNIENNTYLTNARIVNNTNSTDGTITTDNEVTGNSTGSTINNSSGNVHGIDEYIEHVKGKTGSLSYGKSIQEYRDNILNIDMMIIDELSDLFMLLW